MLPSNLKFQNRVDSLGAKAYTSSIQPQGSQSYGVSDTMIFNLPCNRNTVLSPHDTYLKFSMTAVNGATAQPFVRLAKAGASSFIQRLRVFHGSVLIEDLDSYGNLYAQLANHQRSGDNVSYKGSVTEGFEPSCAVLCDGSGAGVNLPTYNINALRGARIHNSVYNATTLAGGATTTVQTFCIPLISILGTLSDKYIPLFAMTSAPLRIEIQLVNSALIPFVSLTAMASFTLSNVEINGSFIELSDQALATVQESLQGKPLTMAVSRWSNLVYNASLLNSVTNVSCPVPMKYSSLDAIICSIRQHSGGAVTFDAFGSYNYNIQEYWWAMGSEQVPSKHPGSSTNGVPDHQTMFQYACSALGSPADLLYNPCVNIYTYDTLTVPVASTETANTTAGNLTSIAGSFLIGQEFSSYPSANQDQIFSGRNTNTEDIVHNLIFQANATTPQVRFDYYGLYSAVLIFQDGAAQIRF
jgi:hypothetical protein